MKYSQKLIKKTFSLWQPIYIKSGKILAKQDAIEILDNMMAFTELLMEIYARQKVEKE